MAVGVRARADVLHRRALCQLGPADDERHHAPAVDQHQPADRPREDQRRPCRPRDRRPSASASGTSGRAARRPSRRPARRPWPCRAGARGTPDRCPSASRCRSSAATSTPYFLAKPAAAGVGLAVGLNAADTGGPVTSSSRSVCRSASLRHARGQPSRRAEGLGRRLGRQPQLLEPGVQVRAELRRQPRQPAGRNLLAADLDQQLAIHAVRRLGTWLRSDPLAGGRLPSARSAAPWRSSRPAAGRAGCRRCARSRRCCRSNRGC